MGCGSSSAAKSQEDKGQESSAGNKSPKPVPKKTEPEKASTEQPNETSKAPTDEVDTEFLNKGVKIHNALRAKHGADPLTPSSDLTAFSQKWANHLAKKDEMVHSTNEQRKAECGGAGENLYYCWSSNPNAGVSAEASVQSWYDEIKDYDFGNQGFNMATGHFTQVVWKDSKELGMAWAKSAGGSYYVVANYRPAGNYMGQFDTNVAPC